MDHVIPRCLACQRTSHEIPLVRVHYREQDYWICSQHFPILIHKPEQLAEFLPGADRFGPSDHED